VNGHELRKVDSRSVFCMDQPRTDTVLNRSPGNVLFLRS
jgi:hypothetical protein